MATAPFLILLWCFAVGACVGSFLNVVAWRMPLGISLLWPGSHCPRCKKPIALRDNVPVLGWLLLRGRCRACGASISPRYPIVEFLTGAACAALAWVELVEAGVNLPELPPETSTGLLGLWLFHSLLMSLLIVLALFEIDAARVPTSFIVLGIMTGIVLPLVRPELSPQSPEAILGHSQVATLESGLVGTVTGLFFGGLISWASTGNLFDRQSLLGYAALALSLVGAFLGPEAVLTIAAVTAALLVVARLTELAIGRSLVRATTILAAVTLVFLLYWRQLTELRWPGHYEGNGEIGFTAISIALLSLIVFVLTSRGARRKTPALR
jgi:prepilin signal peptidase PulO-like enzyme (type II secretory pathway)